MYARPIVPTEFSVPLKLQTDEFTLYPLTINNLIKDYDAVMASVKHLRGLMGNTDKWPDGLTIEENLIDLGWHQREFTLRHSFTYSVMSLDEETCLGCCYIYPSMAAEYDVQVFYWIREELLANGLENKLGTVLRSWLLSAWPFSKVSYPGRDK